MEISEDKIIEFFGQTARQMGLLYLSIAKEIIEKYGDEGRNMILNGIRTFGRTRGERIAEKVKKAGKPLTLENFHKFYDVPVTLITRQSEPEIPQEGKVIRKVSFCPLAAFFEEEDELEIGKLYCEQDFSMIEGYNPEIILEKKKASLMEGDDHCEFVYDLPKGN